MKRVKYLLVFFFLFIISICNVNASAFQPRASIDQEYDGNGIVYIKLWFEGVSLSEVSNTIKYDSTYFTLDSVSSEDYTVNSSIEEKDGSYRIVTITSSTSDDIETGTYAVVGLKMKSSFNVGNTSYITLSDYYASTIDGKKYRNDGLVVRVNYHSLNDIYIITENKTKWSDLNIWFKDRIYTILLFIFIIVLIVVGFIITPHNFFVSNRYKRIRKQIKNNKNNKKLSSLNLNPDDIAKIGTVPKPEPTNKLELGKFNPLEKNVSKPKTNLRKDRDFKQSSVDAFDNKK